MKIAIIGSGASAVGVLQALLKLSSRLEIVLFDIGFSIAEPPKISPDEGGVTAFYDEVYRNIRHLNRIKFPPPKTHYGQLISKESAGPKHKIFKSETFGGLTNYWGATLLPFTDSEMKKWPIRKEALYPYYQQIAEAIGLSAQADALNEYFLYDFATRPPIQPLKILAQLKDMINGSESKTNFFKMRSGVNRCSVETRFEDPNACVYCGECMAGCFRGSIYSARKSIREWFDNSLIRRFIKGRVTQIDFKNRSIEVETHSGGTHFDGFSKIFICAGCPATSEIIMRSLNISSGPVITDNAVYTFPILYFGTNRFDSDHRRYLSLCNLIIACIPLTDTNYFAQVQVYANFDYLWRYNMPIRLWSFVQPLFQQLRSHIFWGRLYVHSDLSQRYPLTLRNGKFQIDYEEGNLKEKYVDELLSSLRKTLNRQGFYVPHVRPVREKTNSHYAGTFPYGGPLINLSASGEIERGIYLCDSSCFPDSPAVSPTFTIMANAMRVATEAMSE